MDLLVLLTKSTERAAEAPIIRQLFSSSPRDPRYHMLSYISSKFSQEPKPHSHEPRAALFLNRFTRTLTIMYATNGLAELLGISADDLNGKSFYYCIQENCLQDAVRCLESAKANDSIAYLRFWFRDPRQDDMTNMSDMTDQDETMSDAPSSDQDEDDEGGVHLDGHIDMDGSENAITSASESSSRYGGSVGNAADHYGNADPTDPNSRSSSGNSTDLNGEATDAVFDQPATANSSQSSLPLSADNQSRRNSRPQNSQYVPSRIELEAVVSCTSDGLVVVLRAARPLLLPSLQSPQRATQPAYANGLFASPWAAQPIVPDAQRRSQHVNTRSDRPSMTPMQPTAAQANATVANGAQSEDFMRTIREVAVFAWSLTGINGSLVQYGRGTPTGESQPPGGMPVWDPDSNVGLEGEKYNRNSFRKQDNDQYWPSSSGQSVNPFSRNSSQIPWNHHSSPLSVGSGHHAPSPAGESLGSRYPKTWS